MKLSFWSIWRNLLLDKSIERAKLVLRETAWWHETPGLGKKSKMNYFDKSKTLQMSRQMGDKKIAVV